MTKRSKKLLQADQFRALVQKLRALPDSDWNDWEADWLDKETARDNDYIYTDKERVILNQLIASATSFEGYNGWSITELLDIAYRYRADLDEDSEAFIERHYRRRPRALRVRQINRVAAICRLTDNVGFSTWVFPDSSHAACRAGREAVPVDYDSHTARLQILIFGEVLKDITASVIFDQHFALGLLCAAKNPCKGQRK